MPRSAERTASITRPLLLGILSGVAVVALSALTAIMVSGLEEAPSSPLLQLSPVSASACALAVSARSHAAPAGRIVLALLLTLPLLYLLSMALAFTLFPLPELLSTDDAQRAEAEAQLLLNTEWLLWQGVALGALICLPIASAIGLLLGKR